MSVDSSAQAADELALRDELTFLARALRGQIEFQALSGTIGVPKAPPSQRGAPGITEPPPIQRESITEPPRSLAPIATTSLTSGHSSPPTGAPARGGNQELSKLPQTLPSVVKPLPVQRVAPVLLDADEKHRQLTVLAQEIRSCSRCGLCERRTQTVFARGTGSSGLCFVGEGPGADEDAQGYPFVGAAGQLLDKIIAAMGLGRDEVYVCNIVKCRPPENRKPLPEEMLACRPYLEQQLEILGPEVIVALGATAVEGLLGTTGGITRLRGTWKLYKGRIAVMPTFHPAYLLRSPNAKHAVWDDMQAVLRQMGRTVPARGKK